MIEYIPISQNLSNVVNNIIKSNGGLSTLAATSCEGNCSGSCSGGCSGSCEGGCKGSCSGSCSGGCKGSCSGSCSGGCSGTCSAPCSGKCMHACEVECAPGCQTRCENGGQTISSYLGGTKTFSWSNIAKDKIINITASEWNQFASIIEQNASFCGASCSVVRVSPKDLISASSFNSLRNNIEKLNNSGVEQKVSQQSIIEAADFLALASAMNTAVIEDIYCCETVGEWDRHEDNDQGPQYGH